MTKAQKWAARAAAASGGNPDTAAAAAAPEPAPAAAAPAPAAAAAANGGEQTVDELRKALEDMRREMMLNSRTHQQEREDLIKKVNEAQELAHKKDEEAKAAGM
jgi:prephenate dehydrogenase